MQIGIGIGITLAGGAGGEALGGYVPPGSNALSALTLAWSAGASELTIGATSSIDLSSGRFGAWVSEGEGVAATAGAWFDGAGAVAGAQSLVLTQAALEAELGALPASAVLNVSHGYSLTDPAVTVVLAASSGVYPTPVVYTAAVDDTTPTEGVLITGSWDMIVGPTGQVISYRYQNVTEGVTNATTLTYTPDAGDVGDTLQFRVTSTLGALSAYDELDAPTDAVAAAAVDVTHIAATANPEASAVTDWGFSHTPDASGAPSAIAIIWSAYGSDASLNGTPTVDTDNMGLVGLEVVDDGGGNIRSVGIYAMVNPGDWDTSAKTIALNFLGSCRGTVVAVSVRNGNATTAMELYTEATGTSATPGVTVSGTSLGTYVIGALSTITQDPTVSGGTEVSEQAYSGGPYGYANIQRKDSAATSTAVSWTMTSGTYAACAAQFKKQ